MVLPFNLITYMDFPLIKEIVTAVVTVVTVYFILRERIVKLEGRIKQLEKETEQLNKNITQFEVKMDGIKEDIHRILISIERIIGKLG